jgi:hypothetical protein
MTPRHRRDGNSSSSPTVQPVNCLLMIPDSDEQVHDPGGQEPSDFSPASFLEGSLPKTPLGSTSLRLQ